MQTIQLVRAFSLSLILVLFGCNGGKLIEGPIHGRVLEVRGEGDPIRVDFSTGWFGGGTEQQVVVEPGDLLWLKDGRDIRGELVRKGEEYELISIWPSSDPDEDQIRKKNKVLRRNTVDRGVAAFRDTGEEIPQFALYDQDGTVFSRDDLKERVSVLHFIFTRCSMPSMCPASTQKMGRLLEVVKSEALEDVRLISISLDPRFDTPGVLKSYARGYGVDAPQSRFLTGPLQPVQDLKKQLGILSKPDEVLIIKHTMRTILIGPDLKIAYHVPNSSWDVEDFLAKIREMTNVDPS
jgi:protein SCO1/2